MAGPTAPLEKAGKGGRYEGNLARDFYWQLGKGAGWLIYNICKAVACADAQLTSQRLCWT